MKHGVIRHLGFILEVDGRGWVANLCASDPPPPPPDQPYYTGGEGVDGVTAGINNIIKYD